MKPRRGRDSPVNDGPNHPKPRCTTWTAAIATVFIVALLGACDSSDAPDAGRRGILRDPSDVRVLGTSDAIAIVEDLEVLPSGAVWVLNSVEPYFVGFSANGKVLQVHGRRGGGPEEFGAPAGFVAGGIDGEAWVFDRERHAVIQVSRPDSGWREIALPRATIPHGRVLEGMNLLSKRVRTARLGEEIILPRASFEREIEARSYWFYVWSPDLVALNVRTDSVRSVVALAQVLGDPRPHFELSGFPPFPLWYRLWAVCADAEIRVYDHIRNQVRGFTREGVEREPIVLPPARYTAVTPHEFARATLELAAVEAMGEVPSHIQLTPADSARILNSLIPRLDLAPDQLANLLPRYVDFRCDETGAQWIQPFDLDTGGLRGGPLWLRIAPDGNIQEVRLPDRFDPYRFTSDRIWGVQRDEFDVASVAWIAIPRTQ
jgi:hypothetical protein